MTLKEWCEGKRQEDVAADLGVDQSYLSRLISGESVGGHATVMRIAEMTDGAVTYEDMVRAAANYRAALA